MLMRTNIRQKCFWTGLVLGGTVLCLLAAAPPDRAAARPNPFFAFDNGTKDAKHQTLEAQADLLKELGYDGISWRPAGVAPMLKVLRERQLKMFAIYTVPSIGEDGPVMDPNLRTAIKELQGTGAFIWLGITSKLFKPGTTNGDDQAVMLLNEVATWAAEANLKVALYPHAGFYHERVADCLRLAEKSGHPNVGVSFNLCHSLKVGEYRQMEDLLKRAGPRLFLVSINGADADGRDWSTLIQTLDRGSLDLLPLFRVLREIRYAGPIGLQCYNLKGDVRDNLRRSMDAWKKYQERLAGLP